MSVYMYAAALYCEDCGHSLSGALTFPAGADRKNESTWDSDEYPKGPFEEGEADSPQHCNDCGAFLQNDLTNDGVDSLHEMIRCAITSGQVTDTLLEWVDFYGIELKDVLKRAKLEPSEERPTSPYGVDEPH